MQIELRAAGPGDVDAITTLWRTGWIEAQLYVDRSFRGTAVAGRLRHDGEQVIAARFDRAGLAVVEGNDRARRFFERSGWSDRGPFVTQAWTSDGIATIAVPARRYEKAVAPDHAAAATVFVGGTTDGGRPA